MIRQIKAYMGYRCENAEKSKERKPKAAKHPPMTRQRAKRRRKQVVEAENDNPNAQLTNRTLVLNVETQTKKREKKALEVNPPLNKETSSDTTSSASTAFTISEI